MKFQEDIEHKQDNTDNTDAKFDNGIECDNININLKLMTESKCSNSFPSLSAAAIKGMFLKPDGDRRFQDLVVKANSFLKQ